MDAAYLRVSVDVKNGTAQAVKGSLRGRIEGIAFEQPVDSRAAQPGRSCSTPRIPATQYCEAACVVAGPASARRISTWRSIEFVAGREVSDSATVSFGIRKVTSELTGEGHRLFRVNGRKILIRGAGWWPDMLLRTSPERQAWEIRYARDLNFNTIRMDGKFEDENFLNLADQAGLMLMPGWCWYDHWERWKDWDDDDRAISAESLGDVIRKLRTHPSVITWLDGDSETASSRN